MNVHTINTRAHIDSGASVNADNAGAGSNQSVHVVAGRSYEGMAIGAGAGLSATVAPSATVVPAASIPILLGTTEAFIDSNHHFTGDAHTGDDFATVVNANKDVEVSASAQEWIVSVAAGVAVSTGVGIAGSGSVVVIDTNTLAAISGNVHVDAGGNVLVAAQDDSETYGIAGAVGAGLGGGAGAVAVSVITKQTEAVIGGGTVVDADGNGATRLNGILTGEMDDEGSFPTESLRGVAVQARSSEDLFGLGASIAGGVYVGVAGAVTVEVVDSDTLAHVIGGAEINQNTSADAHSQQSVNVSAVNELDVLSINGSAGGGGAGVGASVDVGVIRNDSTAVIGGIGTTVRAVDVVDVNALSRRELSGNTISAAAGAVGGLAGGISIYSVGGNFDGSYEAEADDGSTESSDALDGGDDGNVVSMVEDTVGHVIDEFTGQDGDEPLEFGASAVNSSGDTINLGADHGLVTGDTVVYSAGGGTSMGGLEDGRTYFLIVDENQPTRLQLATSHADAVAGEPVDITNTGSGSHHQLLTDSIAIGNWARNSAADRSPAGSVSDATATTTGISSGTTAAIDIGATVEAGSVDVDARQKVTLEALTGGVGLGGGVGIGLGIAVVSLDSDVAAFIAQGTTILGLGGAGSLSVDAQLDSTLRSVGFAGAGGIVAGIGSAVSVITDSGDVNALLGARVNASGEIEEAGSLGGRTTIGGDNFANLSVHAGSDRNLGLATGAGAIAVGGSLGAAITAAEATGTTTALVGDYTQIGDDLAHRAGNLSVFAQSNTSVRPFKDGDPMGIALSGGLLAGAAGVTDVAIGGDAETVYARAEIGEQAIIYAYGDIAVEAASQWEALVSTDGGAVGAVAIGVMVARTDVLGNTQSHIGAGTTIDGHSLDVTTNGEAVATTTTVAAGGGIISGRGSVAETTVETGMTATIGDDVMLNLLGNLTVQTEYLVEGDASAEGYGGGIIDAGVSQSLSTVTPTAEANIGSGGEISVLQDVLVEVTRKQLGPQPVDHIIAVDPSDDFGHDTITYGDFGLGVGDAVQYDAAGADLPGLIDGRQYYVLRTEPGAEEGQVQLTFGVSFEGELDTTRVERG